MATTIKIDPVTRLEGHLKIEVTVDSTSVALSRSSMPRRQAPYSAASRRS